MLAEIQGTSDKTETKAVTADVELENSTTTEEPQVTQETPDTTTEESQAPHETPEITPGGAGLAYVSAVTLTALCVAAMVL